MIYKDTKLSKSRISLAVSMFTKWYKWKSKKVFYIKELNHILHVQKQNEAQNANIKITDIARQFSTRALLNFHL